MTEMIGKDTYGRRNKKSTKPEKLAKGTEIKKKEPIKMIDKYRKNETRREEFKKPERNKDCRHCKVPGWNTTHKCPVRDTTSK